MIPTYAFVPNIVNPWWTVGSSVDLVFTRSLYYDSAAGGPTDVTNLLSISRASIGYANTAAGTLTQFGNNQLRITDLGLLAEGSRTNLQTGSQDMSNASYWTPQAATVATTSAVTAPDGTTTACIQTEDGTTASPHRNASGTLGTLTASVPFTVSCFIKNGLSNGRRYVSFVSIVSGAADRYGIIVDTVTGTVTDTHSAGTPVSPSYVVEAFGNGWYRVQITQTNSAVSGQGFIAICGSDSATPSYDIYAQPIYNGDSASNFYTWGAQMEVGAPASSYIPTTTTSAARAADVVTCIGDLNTITNSSAVSAVLDVIGSAVDKNISLLTNNTVDVIVYDTAGGDKVASWNGSNYLSQYLTGGLTILNGFKCGFAGNASGRSLTANGAAVSTDANAYAAVSNAQLASPNPYVYYRRLTVWNSKIADATLQALTAP